MAFTTRWAAPPLRHAISMLWDWNVAPGEFRFERLLPQPGSALIINLFEDQTRVYSDDALRMCERLPGAVFSGQFTRSFIIDSAEQIAVMGVLFNPGGALNLLRERIDTFGNCHTALEDLVGSPILALRERLLNTGEASARLVVLEEWLLAHCSRRTVDPAVRFALDILGRRPQVSRIGDIAKSSGLSDRRFSTLFREQVGVGAKRYARLQRFRGVVEQSARGLPVEWSRVAADCGFNDQPHLVREFREFSGMTPGAYLAQRREHINHIPLPVV